MFLFDKDIYESLNFFDNIGFKEGRQSARIACVLSYSLFGSVRRLWCAYKKPSADAFFILIPTRLLFPQQREIYLPHQVY